MEPGRPGRTFLGKNILRTAAGEPAKHHSGLCASLIITWGYLLSGATVMDQQIHWKKICREKAPVAVSWYRPHLGDLACSHRADCPWTSFIRRETEDESDRALCRRDVAEREGF